MEDIRQQQIEALSVLGEYNKKLVKAVKEIVIELNGQQRPDTEEFLKQIVDGINWEIQVVNGTLDYINEDEALLDKDEFNNAILRHNDAVQSREDSIIAQSLEENVLPYLIMLDDIVLKKAV